MSEIDNWIPIVGSPPGVWNRNIMTPNSKEFLVIIGDDKIYKYRSSGPAAHSGHWSVFLDTSNEFIFNELSQFEVIIRSKFSTRVYTVSCTGNNFPSYIPWTIMDRRTQCIIHQSPKYKYGYGRHYGVGIVNANGVIHRVAYMKDIHNDYPFEHDIWNETTKEWDHNEKVQVTGLDGDWCDEGGHTFQWPESVSLIHVPSKNIILLFGGFRCVDTNEDEYPFGIWEYDLSSGRWYKRDEAGENFNFYLSSFVLTADEQYIVIVGAEEIFDTDPDLLWGLTREERRELGVAERAVPHRLQNGFLYVLDITKKRKFELCFCPIKPPSHIPCRYGASQHSRCKYSVARSSGSSFVTLGWIRRLFATDEFEEMALPATVITNMIEQYCPFEMIHWISCCGPVENETNHQMIPLDTILESIEEDE